MKKQDDSLKKELDKGNNFVDYFVTIGMKQDLIFSDFLYENDLNTINQSELINPEILSKFPPFDKTTINIDENMIKHCFPNGYKIIESNTPPNPESFCFILDNNFFSINFPQKYISCLIFYESLGTYKKVYDKYKAYDTDTNFDTESGFNSDRLSSLSKVDQSFMMPSITVCNTIEFTYTTTNREVNSNEYNTNSDVVSVNNYNTETNSNLRSTTVACKSRNQLNEALRISKNYFTNSNHSSAKYRHYYAPKCICLVSVYPFFIEFAKILKTIYKFTRNGKLRKPIEKIIENLVVEVPVPPRGFYSVEYQLFNEKYILTQTPMNKLPFLSIEFEKIFINFNIDQILEIYKNVLLETRLIFFGSDLSNLTPIVQGFISLIYPFKYPFQFVTILPEENFNFLESVSPYIIGINLKYHRNFFIDNDIDIENMTILIIDIDHRKIELTSPNLSKISDHNSRRKYMQEEFPDLPYHYKTKLVNRINEYITKIKSKTKEKESSEKFSLTIRNLFFQFIVNILQNYNKYLNTDYYTNNEITSPSINTLFKVEDFINSFNNCDKPFYRKLVKETQIFVEFILKRMIPKDSKEKLEILFFDENLMEKASRRIFGKKVYTPFIHTNLYDIKHTYSVQKHRGFAEEEIDYFKKDISHRKEALRSGQEIFFEKGEICISYPIFPCMMNEVFFKNSVRLYFIPPNLSEELEPINIDMVSKSHLGSVSLHYSEMENYIYLCWIQLWAMTFWYHDEIEKRYRFQQLLQVLDMVINHEMEIFNILFETLSKHGEDFMIMKLYERLVYYKLNPSYSICTTVMKLIDKKQLLTKIGVGSIIKYVERYDFKQKYDTTRFRNRSIKNKYDLNILNDDVRFYTWDTCIECQKSINLEKLSRDFHNMRRDILWAICPNCGAGLLPKINVRFGREMNTFDKLKFHTSSYEGFVLYSPFYLKYNYNNGLLKEFGIKLDIDSFKLRFNAIFWDSIWYFKIKELVFDFMLPYEAKVDVKNLETYASNCFTIKTVGKFSKPEKKKGSEGEGDQSNKSNKEPKIDEFIDDIQEFQCDNNENLDKQSDLKKFNENSLTNQKVSQVSISTEGYLHIKYFGDDIEVKKENIHQQEISNTNINLVSPTSQHDTFSANNQNYAENTIHTDYNPSVCMTEQSFINPNMLVDNTFCETSSRILETDQSVFSDLESFRGYKKNFAQQLNTITEDANENVMLEYKDSSPDFKKNDTDKNNRSLDLLKEHEKVIENVDFKSESNSKKSILFSDNNLVEIKAYNSENLKNSGIINIFSLKKQNSNPKHDDLRFSNSFFVTKKTSISDSPNERDKTPIKSDYQSDKDMIYIFKENYSRNLRKRSLENENIFSQSSPRIEGERNETNSLQNIIEKLDLHEYKVNETSEKSIS